MAGTDEKKQSALSALDPATIELIKTIAAELRKPTELEQEELNEHKAKRDAEKERIAQAQRDRKEGALLVKQQIAKREAEKKVCLHEGGTPVHQYAVFVHDPLGGYILCQRCQMVVRPSEQRGHYPQDYHGSVTFDTALFNRLFQRTSDSGIFA